MFKKTITYETFLGEQLTEDFYFNLNTAEVAQFALRYNGHFQDYVKKAIDAHEYTKVGVLFNEFIQASYGEKSPDGKHFYKKHPVDGHPLINDFMATNAFNVLYEELLSDGKFAAQFLDGIIPQDSLNKIENANAANGAMPA